MLEEWRPFFEGIYLVSNLGNIRRADGRVKKSSISNNGYRIFGAFKEGARKNILVHRAVAECFMGACPSGLEVNHKDGNKLNNCAENLEYVTRSVNQKHAVRLGLSKPSPNRYFHRGDSHWTRRHPELVRRGDDNGARKYPERILRGEYCPASRLTTDAVLEIRRFCANGELRSRVANHFGISVRTVADIVNRKSWRHI
jgi:hypothetical protein